MPQFFVGDRVKYVGPNYDCREAIIRGIKVLNSVINDCPIYNIRWYGEEEDNHYGILEIHLKLVKRKSPDWVV